MGREATVGRTVRFSCRIVRLRGERNDLGRSFLTSSVACSRTRLMRCCVCRCCRHLPVFFPCYFPPRKKKQNKKKRLKSLEIAISWFPARDHFLPSPQACSALRLCPPPPEIHPPNRAVNCHQFIPTKQLLMCFISSTSSTAQTSCPSAFFFMLLSIKWTPKQRYHPSSQQG